MRELRNHTGGVTVLLICGMFAGCRHQPVAPVVSTKAQTPNIFVKPPTTEDLPPMQTGDLPHAVTDAKPPVAAEVKPKKRTKRQPPPTVAQVTPPPPPEPVLVETAKLGDLAPGGGDTSHQQQQEVAGKIAAVEKRVNDLPIAVADREQKQIAKVKLFLKEAADALKGGDVGGAKILATKADLLVDDVQEVSR